MKLLTCNIGYLLGYQNVLWGYAPPPVSSLIGDADRERRKLEQLLSVIDAERPDVVSLLEVDQGSHRTATDGQFRALVESLRAQGHPYQGTVANKYSDSALIDSVPFYGQLGNAVLTRTETVTGSSANLRTHYLSVGRKRLVIEREITSDTVLFVVHLSLGSQSRSRQLAELAELVLDRANGRDVVVTGDFNTFDGTDDLERFAERVGLEKQTPGETIPARPLDEWFIDSRSLDLFFCPPSLDIERCDVLDVQVSDHRPIVLEIAQ